MLIEYDKNITVRFFVTFGLLRKIVVYNNSSLTGQFMSCVIKY